VFEDGFLFEGTGLLGHSSLRKTNLETGEILQKRDMPPQYFGEGITVFDGRIVQLTWRSNIGFVYKKDNFNLVEDFSYPTEGWGVTSDGQKLIMSDGTEYLYFLDPEDYSITGNVRVTEDGTAVTKLNELEYIDGMVYANVWLTDRIAIIDPGDGRVTGWIDLTGLLETTGYEEPPDVLNGIAYDSEEARLFVTGKLWPSLFEIELVPS
jgi:glutamine cyclotransferase